MRIRIAKRRWKKKGSSKIGYLFEGLNELAVAIVFQNVRLSVETKKMTDLPRHQAFEKLIFNFFIVCFFSITKEEVELLYLKGMGPKNLRRVDTGYYVHSLYY